MLCCSPLLPCRSPGQSLPAPSSFVRGHTIPINISLKDSTLRLPHQFIVAGSDSIVMDSSRVLRRHIEYAIDYRHGTLKFDSLFLRSATSDSLGLRHFITMAYRFLPFHFQDSYYHRKLVVMKDSTGADSMRVSKPKSSFNVDDIFGPNLQKSGSIVRGFTVGSDRDLSLNSGLRLQLSGKIASDVDIVASLTDESTPIQPEGTTQTLQEFDKVFVEIRSTDVAATLGDFNLDFDHTEFARLSRKLQGARGIADYRAGFGDGSVTLAGAVARGKFTTNQIQGLEAVQGPYRLVGRNNERTIIVIAGTEKVYVNGEPQVRGETNDYTIDYSTGEVTFAPRRLITSASRIVVDFQYTDRQYSRSLLAAQTTSNLAESKVRLRFSYFREADDQDSPIDFALTDSARSVLEQAGNDRDKAVLSGVTQVDSNGFYVRIDTLSNGVPTRFYRYAPDDRAAKYNVVFSSVAFGKGDYIRQQAGVFVWKGPGGGDYVPLLYLPMPQLEQLVDMALEVTPVSDLKITGEFGRSLFDANRFSSLNDQDNFGNAFKFTATYKPRNVRIGGISIGGFDIDLNERLVSRRFVPIDRTNDIEFNRKWGFEGTPSTDEEIQEASLKYFPGSSISVQGGYGKIKKGEDVTSTRNDASLSVKGEGLPTTTYYIENVTSRETLLDNNSTWLRNKGMTEYSFRMVTPSFRYEGEKRTIISLSTASAKPGSFSYGVFAPGIRVKGLGPLSLSAEYEWRSDNVFNVGSVRRESSSFTQNYAARLAEWNNLISSIDLTFREKKFSPEFKQLGNSDIKTILVRSQNRYTPLNHGLETDLLYEVATEKASRLERVFVKVAQGAGNYTYLGDLNNNSVADETEFTLERFGGDFISLTIPTDELFPVIDLKTSMRTRIVPRLFLGNESGFLRDIASMLTAETYVRVEEKSTERDLKQIYLLHFSKFQQDSTTITGATLFTQDLNLWEGQAAFSARLRYSQRTGLNRMSEGIERSYARERSVRLRWQLVREISNQVDLVNKIDRVASAEPSNRLRDIMSNTATFDLSYRPEQNVEVGMKFDIGQSTDRLPTPEVIADLNAQSLRCVYAFQGAGQARAEVSREEIRLGNLSQTLPFELTGGRVEGKTWLWRAAFDYRVTQFIQASMNYDGRSEGGRSPVHTARAEVRAFF